jgi:hypothetical protein
VLTGIAGIACRDDAVEPHGLTSAAVKARDVVVRSTSGRGKVMRITFNEPSERFNGILDAN